LANLFSYVLSVLYFLSLYILSFYMFCRYTFGLFIRFVVLPFVSLYVLSLYVLVFYMFCHYLFCLFILFGVIRYVLSMFCHIPFPIMCGILQRVDFTLLHPVTNYSQGCQYLLTLSHNFTTGFQVTNETSSRQWPLIMPKNNLLQYL
jgi:hypothetical protein